MSLIELFIPSILPNTVGNDIEEVQDYITDVIEHTPYGTVMRVKVVAYNKNRGKNIKFYRAYVTLERWVNSPQANKLRRGLKEGAGGQIDFDGGFWKVYLNKNKVKTVSSRSSTPELEEEKQIYAKPKIIIENSDANNKENNKNLKPVASAFKPTPRTFYKAPLEGYVMVPEHFVKVSIDLYEYNRRLHNRIAELEGLLFPEPKLSEQEQQEFDEFVAQTYQ